MLIEGVHSVSGAVFNESFLYSLPKQGKAGREVPYEENWPRCPLLVF